MAILIIFVIAFAFCVPKCMRSQNCTCCDTSTKCYTCCKRYCCDCKLCCWNLVDHHMRGTIIVKFAYFMLKPLLIYMTQTTSTTKVNKTTDYTMIANVLHNQCISIHYIEH